MNEFSADAISNLHRLATTVIVFVLRRPHCVKRNITNHLLFGTALRVAQVNGLKVDVVVFEKVFDHKDSDRIFSTYHLDCYNLKRERGKEIHVGGGTLHNATLRQLSIKNLKPLRKSLNRNPTSNQYYILTGNIVIYLGHLY